MMRFFFKTPLIYGLICIVSLLLTQTVDLRAEESTVSAVLTPKTFSTQQPARLAITVEGRKDAQVTMPEVKGLIFHRRGQSSQFQMINGTSSSSVTYTFLVQATEPGDYTIPPITVSTGSTTQTTEEISCTVSDTPPTLPKNQRPQSAPVQRTIEEPDEAVAFIRLIPEKENAYVGESISTTIKAYFYQGVKFKFNALPELKGDGFLIDALSNEPQQQQEVIDGKQYLVLIWDTMLTGIKEGPNDVTMEMDVSMLVRSHQQSRRLPGFGGGLRDDFFDDFFSTYENQPIKVTASPVSMHVSALPEEGRPDQFSGAIGTFRLAVEAQPTTIAPGDPITVTMSITGTGNFDNVSAPLLTDSEGIKTYTPISSFHPGNQGEEDRKVFEQALVITDAKIKQIPPAVFSYFDPLREQYQSLYSDPIQIRLSSPIPAANTARTPNTSPGQDEEAPSSEPGLPFAGLAPVKLTTGQFIGTIRPLFKQPLFIFTAVLLFAAIAGISGYRLRSHLLARNPGAVRRKRIERERASCLRSFDGMTSLDQAAYLSSAQQKIRNLLALLWECEAASITTADIKNHLGSDHPLTRLFSHCDNASYGAFELKETERDKLHKEITETLASLT